ncbi:hypothetical protein BAE44_0012500 [Dichanthelium oligosanthes]|uniref:Disease resistance N-terminal domain-containing protein n=1 Tax=Dichanthelium oligosanthes TaxID=888268 RepID=A0A1E5VMX7_9POAL|nr:hypothetical protein BAE44_0012500 [Dichanthelium oligosanthes]
MMELVVSAVTGDLVNRFISFLVNKYRGEENLQEKMERLQDLLTRVHMIVEEADVRYITNSMMLFQLKKLVEVMYQGYHVLDTIKYRSPRLAQGLKRRLNFNDLSLSTSVSWLSRMKTDSISHDLQLTLDNLESIISNMKEFVLLLGGCERMSRSPYDSYLYIDNFMFGRHVEKQQIINILLQDNLPPFTPAVLPVIGGSRVGKKTLIAHVCNDEKIRSQFSSIYHLNGENIGTMEHAPFMTGKSLVVVHFASDVDDETWLKFYSSAAKQTGIGSKIIVISRIKMLSRLGTVKPVCLNSLSNAEYSYLFKVLAFGSTNPEEHHPQLVSVAKDLAMALGGSLITANVYAHMLRKNQNVAFWLSMLQSYRNVVENNLSVFGEHPKNLMDKDHPIDITRFASMSSSATIRLMPPHNEIDHPKRELPKLMFGDLIAGSAVLPKEEFELVAWESRIPPYKRFVNLATYCDENTTHQQQHTPPPSKKCKQ